MRSPNIKAASPINFTISNASTAVLCSSGKYETKQLPSHRYQQSTVSNTAWATELTRSKKDQTPLKKIINCENPANMSSNRLRQQTLLKYTTLYQGEAQKSYTAVRKLQNTENREERKPRSKNGNLEDPNKAQNVERILQKIAKKQKLIQELKQLSKISITDMIKNPIREGKDKIGANTIMQKTSRGSNEAKRDYFSEPNKEKISDSKTYKIDFNKSTVQYKKQVEKSPIHLKERLQLKLSDRLKNPEDQRSRNFKKAKDGYYSHRQAKSEDKIEEELTPLIGLGKKYSLNQREKREIQTMQLHKSSKNSYDYHMEVSPLTPRGQQLKSIQDIRLRRSKNLASYFSNKNGSIYDFSLLKNLGEGKFGTVVQAMHRATNSIYAIKKILKKNIKNNAMIDQLIKEIKLQSYCSHQNILQIFGVFDDHEYIYLVLEYMDQGTLYDQLKKKKRFSETEAAIMVKHVVKAVLYLHDNEIAHRDIKPENIVMSNGIGKLCDFGWATLCGADRRKTYCGTFDYAAPEILEGVEYDLSVDLWCLGVLTYELLVGKAPFFHLSKKQTMKRIMNVQNETIAFPSYLSKAAISFIQNLVRKNPEERLKGIHILHHPFITLAKQ